MTGPDQVERLRRRLDRERRARLEAEAIAEQGIRDLYAANRSLDERIAARTIQLEEARRAAEAASAAKGEFLAHIGHELRTPINGITGMLELLDKVVTEPRAREWLASARSSTDRLEHLFDRILWFIDLETAELAGRASAVPVDEVLEAAAERWRRSCARAGQLLATDPATPAHRAVVATDELGRALDELLENAVTHAEPGSVRLTAEDHGTTVRFTVDDSGPGPPDAVVAGANPVLDPGGSPTTRRGTGAGIGLALVRRIAEALGGSSGVERGDAGGTCAWIRVPTAADPRAAQPDSASSR